jgi:predicted CXXCH cytochrome family protein
MEMTPPNLKNRLHPLLACLLIATLGLLITLCGVFEAQAQEKSCTAQCHSQMGKAKTVHPAIMMDCTMCHNPLDEKTMYDGPNHKFKLAAEGADLCYICHEPKNTKKVVHNPVQGGMCTFCHNPHQSENDSLLRQDTQPKLCFQCHEANKDSEKFVHGPVSMGLCTSCHNPHQSENARLLQKGDPDLCYLCHSGKQEAISNEKVVHPAVMMGCTGCHDPHTSPNEYQLTTAPPDLCFMCHGNIQEILAKAKLVHGAVEQDAKCMNCHEPHATAQEKLLKREGTALCLWCHNKSIKDHKGKKLENMKALLEKNPNHHGPILFGQCYSCHNPHGSENFRLLVRAFPETFYASFQEESYALCFGCHDSSLAKVPRTTSDTGFRNGEKNLHFVHVNKSPKGRTCRICHEIHASTKPKHLRESIAFGQWELPLNYQAFPNGGKCLPGCHAPFGYDRETAVSNPIDYEKFGAPQPKVTAPPETPAQEPPTKAAEAPEATPKTQ